MSTWSVQSSIVGITAYIIVAGNEGAGYYTGHYDSFISLGL